MNRRTRRQIALQRIETLYRLSHSTYKTNPELSRRYIHLLRRIAQKNRTHLPHHIRRGICRKCNTPQIQGTTTHTRLKQRREPHITRTCHNCGNITRTPTRPKQ